MTSKDTRIVSHNLLKAPTTRMRVLFLDQTGQLGGAELALLDVVKPYRDNCLVCLLNDGSFRHLLEQQQTPVQVLTTQPIRVSKNSSIVQGLSSLSKVLPLIIQVARLSHHYDLIYANTQKALVIGALASFLSRRPLIYHLHDILSQDHFSKGNISLAITLANRFSSLVIANSNATSAAFIKAGGRSELVHIVYNGFDPKSYQNNQSNRVEFRQQLGIEGKFVVGHFSRLSHWKGQHILLEALTLCPDDVMAIFVGDALFGEQDYVQQLQKQVIDLKLEKRVQFLGFRSDVPQVMAACDLVAHTSIAPEPFGRVIVESMLCGTPIVAAKDGGAVELVNHNETGWLVSPGNPVELASAIIASRDHPQHTATVAYRARTEATQRFHRETINQQIVQLLHSVTSNPR